MPKNKIALQGIKKTKKVHYYRTKAALRFFANAAPKKTFLSYNNKGETFKDGTKMIKRGELYYADLSPVVGSEQGGVRPVLVVQNDVGNKYSPTVIAVAVTSKLTKAKLPTHIEISAEEYGLTKDSVILMEQIRTIDKRRLKERIGQLSPAIMYKVEKALLISLGVVNNA